MGKIGLTLSAVVAVASTTSAGADQLSDLIGSGKGGICYDRVYDKKHLDKHPIQQTRAIRLSLRDFGRSGGGAIIRIMVSKTKETSYIVGECSFEARANLDAMGKPLIKAFKGPDGLDCHAMTSADGASAEEGGDFPIDLRDGESILLHVPDVLAGWPSFDRSEPAKWLKFGADDRVFRLERVDSGVCREMDQKLPWLD